MVILFEFNKNSISSIFHVLYYWTENEFLDGWNDFDKNPESDNDSPYFYQLLDNLLNGEH